MLHLNSLGFRTDEPVDPGLLFVFPARAPGELARETVNLETLCAEVLQELAVNSPDAA